jgi:hypothetical protein
MTRSACGIEKIGIIRVPRKEVRVLREKECKESKNGKRVRCN